MDGSPNVAAWEALSQALGLPHDRTRLADLAPEIERLFESIRRLRAMELEGMEMAIGLRLRAEDTHDGR